ncbi:MAG: pyruvate dehydrogenase (acetyl-transferring) E1 component subunit alpha [Candidatus Nanohaloarchaeota archaeon QJJ-7]|nr:pyruvate dehydrogenase (acetyl-transferring) E1 component subunit alpha [Candidatus Nanohaloarchaeota archaeon QJJ-7]
MPREEVASFSIEKLQVLDEEGELDEELAPDLSEDELLEMYRTMKRSRRLDEKAISLQRRGEIGTYAPAIGQEAAQVGSAYALEQDDWMVPSFREQPAYLTRGVPMHVLIWYAMGMEESGESDDTNMPPSIPVGSQTLHAAGIGWSQEIKGDESASLVYFGDGATSEGDFHEAMNFAGVFDAHTVFICQNNQYAISVPREQQTKAETLAQKAIGQGIDTVQVDGNDIFAVYKATEEALEKARDGDPQMVEAVTYRQSLHTTSDDPKVYRDEEEVEEWKEKDPIDRLEIHLKEEGVLDEEKIDEMEEEIEDEVEEQVEKAREVEDAVDAEDMFEHVYSEMPPYLQEQLEEFREVKG